MTGLLNRRTFREKLMLALLRAREEKSELCLAFMDLDDLKEVNDTYGHREGDWYINTFAAILRNFISENDIAGRVGGDEFAIVFTKCSQHVAEDCIRRIQQQLESMASCTGKPYAMWASVGLVSVTAGTEIDVESLLHKADNAMYQQKYLRRQKKVT
jgi:diguanylate cyclase (GGDEF)-like protein